jgi:hypothetical protein
MKTKSLKRYTSVFARVLISGDAAHLLGANMRSFIELSAFLSAAK